MNFADADERGDAEAIVVGPSSASDPILVQAVAWEEILNARFRCNDTSNQDEGESPSEADLTHRDLLEGEQSSISSNHTAADTGCPAYDLDSPSINAISNSSDDEPDPAAVQSAEHATARETKSNDASVCHKHWNPIWLSRASLFAFAALYGLLALALILLWYFSDRVHGFPLLITNHYAWTYGPTAVLVIIVSLWRQVDFWCKGLLPWHKLKQGDAPADISLALDHISPILPTVFYRAVRFRHTPVIITVIGFALLKGITIASTALLVSEATRVPTTNVTLVASTAFKPLTNFSVNGISESRMAYEAYALLAYGLPYPDGLKGNVLYQSFDADTAINHTDTQIDAEVDAFYPFFECEEATVEVIGNYYSSIYGGLDYEAYANISVQWSSCPETQHTPQESTIDIRDPDYDICPPRQLFGQANMTYCASGQNDFWLLLTMTDVRFNQTEEAGAIYRSERRNETGSWGIQIMPITAMSCKVGYSIEKAKVTYDHSQVPPAISVVGPLTRTNTLLEGFDIATFAGLYTSEFRDAIDMLGDVVSNELQLEEADTFFDMMTAAANSNYETFLQNSSKLLEAATTVFNHSAIQLALYWVMEENASTPLQGSISKTEDRLHMTLLPLCLMVAGLLLMLMATVVVAISRPVDVVPCNIETIGGVALITAQSKGLQFLLQDAGRMGTASISTLLSTYKFRSSSSDVSTTTDKFLVQVLSESGEPIANLERTPARSFDQGPQRWWVPIPLRLPVFLLISALPLSLIATLEVLQRLSVHNNGITNTRSSGDITTVIGTRIIPAFVMVLVATCYNAIDFNVSLLAPFYKLRQGPQAARTTIMSSLMGKMPLHALVLAIAHAHWAAIFSILAALIGSVLTIVVSGLYTVEDTLGTQDIVLQRMDTFDPTWSDSVFDDGGAAALLSDLEELNVSYPAYTWSELAVPTVQLSSMSAALVKGGGQNQSTMTVILPALRASLECSVVPESDFSLSFPGDQGIPYGATGGLLLNGTAALPTDCQLGGIAGNLSFVEWVAGTEELLEATGWWGQVMDLHVGPWHEDDNYYSYGEYNITTQGNNPPGCSSLLFVFGNFNRSMSSDGRYDYFDSTPSNFTPMVCNQLMTEIDTEVTFTLPNFTITSAEPDESTIRYMNSGHNGKRAFSYRPQVHWDLELELWSAEAHSYDETGYSTPYIEEDHLGDYGSVDPFFAAILAGKQAVDPTSLWGPKNQDHLQEAIQGMYRRYMAQVISSKMRVTTNGSRETYTASWQDPLQIIPRLKQNNASKITLQAMLGTMFVFGVAAYLLIDIRALLPHNPCSIAGTVSLLAGSELCGEDFVASLPQGAEWMTEKEVRRREIWKSRQFSMGWWEQARFGIDLGRGDKNLGWTRVWDEGGWRLSMSK
jgi:hypothetical protein